ncbi:hypothetical protein GCK72_025860 [Caenorhabditis remanei]|uniref:Uncharacterized protein n=1 Tax=Caenorhabditis remanei TaxID=31234 RepID=A0A6A5G3X0_CAERE|nr:hypothetical protein GCK72_025860 [Caenorhabditis remanei]KAF1749392.1 hypothetical protein GCK72_025860 [Caenorhabditis remanei]
MFHTTADFAKSLWSVLFRESEGEETYSESEVIRIYEKSTSPGLTNKILQKFGCSLAEILTHSAYFYKDNEEWKIHRCNDKFGRPLDEENRHKMYVPAQNSLPMSIVDFHHNHSPNWNEEDRELIPGERGWALHTEPKWTSRYDRNAALGLPSNGNQERGREDSFSSTSSVTVPPEVLERFASIVISSRFDGNQPSASKRQLPASRVVFGDAREVLKTNIAATAQKLPVGKFSIDDLIEEIRSLSNGDKKQVNDMTRYYLFNMNKRQFSLVDGSGGAQANKLYE